MKKIVAIVGPTAVGKSSLAIDLAKEFGWEIISADSRQIYKYLDIIAGKVTPEEMDAIPHHLLSIVEPGEEFSVAEFQARAFEIIDDIHSRGKLPILAGGTGMYVSSITQGYEFSDVEPDEKLREELEKLSVKELREKLLKLSPQATLSRSEAFNRHRMIRRIEKLASGQPDQPSQSPRYDALTIGLEIAREELEERIRERVHSRLDDGAIEEVEGLCEMFGETFGEDQLEKKMKQIGLSYYVIWRYLQGDYDYSKMIEKFVRAEMQYAKRQMTWWKKDKSIVWIPYEEALDASRKLLKVFLS
jgi:tRNA dimethylallyltransferase